MSYVCPSCKTEITRYELTGVYMHPDADIPYLEKHGSVYMRLGGQIKGIAMLTCPDCGNIFFLTLDKAKDLNLFKSDPPAPYPLKEEKQNEKP